MKQRKYVILTIILIVSLMAIIANCKGLTPAVLGGLPCILGVIGAGITIPQLTINNK